MSEVKECHVDEAELKKVAERLNKKGKVIAGDKGKLANLLEKVEKKNKESWSAEATGPVKELLDNVMLLGSLVKNYVSGEYKVIPVSSIAVIAGVLLYFISPVDLIADVIPVVGWLDDIAVVGFAITQIASDLAKYREWKDKRDSAEALSEKMS
jgi:uncharacterized membrane protein YkvA (DUF1232 family)